MPWALRTLGGYNHSLLSMCVHSIKANGIQHVAVVNAKQHEALEEAAEKLGLHCLFARQSAQDCQVMFSMLHSALSHFLHHSRHHALLLLPVHMPIVRSATIHTLLQTSEQMQREQAKAPVLCPYFLDQRGYPLLLPRQHVQAILDQWNEKGSGALQDYLDSLRSLRLRPDWLPESSPQLMVDHDLIELPLPDVGTTRELNTEQELELAEEYLYETEGRSLPGVEEAWHMLLQSGLPRVKLRHSVLVALGALRLGVALTQTKEKALYCDSLLLHVSAGLLHDIVRYQRRHAETGALLLWRMGWPRAALVAGRHQQLPPPCLAFLELTADPQDEPTDALAFPTQPDSCLLSATLCVNMADKYTQDDQQVPLATRFARVGQRAQHEPHIKAAMERRKEQTREVASRLRQYCGMDPEIIISHPSGHALEAPLLEIFQHFQDS